MSERARPARGKMRRCAVTRCNATPLFCRPHRAGGVSAPSCLTAGRALRNRRSHSHASKNHQLATRVSMRLFAHSGVDYFLLLRVQKRLSNRKKMRHSYSRAHSFLRFSDWPAVALRQPSALLPGCRARSRCFCFRAPDRSLPLRRLCDFPASGKPRPRSSQRMDLCSAGPLLWLPPALLPPCPPRFADFLCQPCRCCCCRCWRDAAPDASRLRRRTRGLRRVRWCSADVCSADNSRSPARRCSFMPSGPRATPPRPRR